MFMIDYKKPILAFLLGMERPRKIRIKAEREGNWVYYTPQAKWFFAWHDNRYKTRSPKTLMWSIYGPKASQGRRVEDIAVVGVADKILGKMLKDQARKLDFFPFEPPEEGA